MIRIGIDLGGTKIEIVALDQEGNELIRRRIPTPQGDYMATVMAMVSMVETVEGELSQRGSVGVGIPGAESTRSGLIKNANSVCLIGQPLRRDLQALLHREVRLANDANCFVLSEARDGAGRGADVVFGVILGTGVGGGLCVAGQLIVGRNAIAGEWGHNRLPGEEEFWPPCYCGRSGCIETFLSGPGLAADHLFHFGEALSPEAIAQQATPACQASLDRYEARLGRALAVVINILDPDVIVLGGGLSNIDRLYHNVPWYWAPHVFSDQVDTRLVRHAHGDASGVRGAACLWP